jgi:hypothetical protein
VVPYGGALIYCAIKTPVIRAQQGTVSIIRLSDAIIKLFSQGSFGSFILKKPLKRIDGTRCVRALGFISLHTCLAEEGWITRRKYA